MITGQILLGVAVAGLASGTGFLLLALISAWRFRRRLDDPRSGHLPPASLLKPLCGLEPHLEANLESFFSQDYPAFEIVFGTRHRDDPALQVVHNLQRRHPRVSVKIVHSGEPDRPNAKVCSLEKMYAAAAFDFLVISDSDVRVAPGYLRDVISPLLGPAVGLVTCLYRGLPTGGIWSRLEALGMSVEMTSGVLVAEMLEGMRFALGPTMATRRDVLSQAGGLGDLANYCADDYLLGQRIFRSGLKVVLSRHVIDHVALHRTLLASLAHQLRWMKSTRFSRPKGHIGMLLTFAMPFGILGIIAGIALGHPVLGTALLAWAVLNRMIQSAVVGWGVVRDPGALRFCWLYPVRDLLGFGLWCASFLGRTIVWRDTRYRLEKGGKMTRIGATVHKSPAAETVAADHPA